MAQIVQGIGMSHSGMMAFEGEYWKTYSDSDLRHSQLYNEAGEHLSYLELEKQRDAKYAAEAKQEKMIELHEEMTRCFGRLKEDFRNAQIDLAVIVSNDHRGEFLEPHNVPALAVYADDRIVTVDEVKKIKKNIMKPKMDPDSEPFKKMIKEKGLDKNNIWPGSRKYAEHIIESLIEQEFDLGVLREQPDPSLTGHGHGYSMVVTKLMGDELLTPMVPIYLNIWPPNAITPSRGYDFGRALRRAIESIPDPLRVAVIASGGLSHFVTDVGLDQHVLTALRNRSEQELRNLQVQRMKAGTGEIRNWVVLAAATEHLQLAWDEYLPVFRTPAGTGIGMAFARWS